MTRYLMTLLWIVAALAAPSVASGQPEVDARRVVVGTAGATCSIRSGSGAPSTSLGAVCDTYLRTDSPYTVYVKTGASQWVEMHPAAGTTGDLIFGASATTIGRLPAVASGQVLTSAGTSTAPAWSATPTISGTVTLNGNPGFTVSATNAQIRIDDSDAAADNRLWVVRGENESFVLRAINDANSAGTNFFQVERTGTSIDSITLAPNGGDIILNPGGSDILPGSGYSKNLGSLTSKYLTLHAAELWVETLVAQNTIATIGGRVLVGPTTTLTSDLTSVATSIVVKHNQMNSGDRVYMEANGAIEFMAITSGASGSGPYTYSVTRDLDGTGANAWTAGDAVFNTGQTGSGFIDLYSFASATFPGYQAIFNFDAGGSTYSANYADAATYPLLGDSANNTINDAAYFGAPAIFGRLSAFVLTPLSLGTGVVAYEYWNGSAWTGFTPTGTGFTAAGPGEAILGTLSGWATTTVNSVSAYWVRIRVTTVGSGITAGLWQTVRRGQQQWGPTIVGNVRTSSTFNDWYPRWAIGNLNGLYGYSTNVYGAAFGDDLAANIAMDATNGIRIRHGTTNKFTADTSGNLSIVGDLSVGAAGVIRSGATSYASGTGYVLDFNGGTPRMRVGTTAGNRVAWDGTDLTLVSANLTIGSAGVLISPATTYSAARSYGFSTATGSLGVFGLDGGSTFNRALFLQSQWTGTGDLSNGVGVELQAAHTPSSGGTSFTAGVKLDATSARAVVTLSAPGTGSQVIVTTPSIVTDASVGTVSGTEVPFTTGIAFTADTTAPAGGLAQTTAAGLTMRGISGSTYDFSVRDAAGNDTIVILPGTSEVALRGVATDGTGKVLCIKADLAIGTCNATTIGASTCTCS